MEKAKKAYKERTESSKALKAVWVYPETFAKIKAFSEELKTSKTKITEQAMKDFNPKPE